MLTVRQLKALLRLNEYELKKLIAKGDKSNRIFELNFHRAIVKNELIETLERELYGRRSSDKRKNKVA